MIEQKNKISIHQMQILMLFNILGCSILTFPKLISKASNNAFVFSIILGILFAVFSTFLILYSLKESNGTSFNEFLKDTCGTFFSKIIILVFLTKIVFSLSTILNIFVRMTNNILLPKTNSSLILFLFLLLTGYLCYKEQSVRAKTSQVIFYIFLLYILVFVVVSIFNIKIENLPNVLNANSIDLFQGSLTTFFAFSSIIFFYFEYFYIEKKETIIKSSIGVIVLTGLLVLLFTLICISTFTLVGVRYLSFPTFDAMARISVANSFITRNEALVLNFWIFVIFSFVATGVFYGHLLFADFFNLKNINNKFYIFLISFILFVMNMLEINETILKIVDLYISVFLMIVLPIIFLLKTKLSINSQKTIALFLIVPILLTSCYDKIELEDRRFVYEIYIDKNLDDFVMTYDYPRIDEAKNEQLKILSSKDKTILGCINKAYMANENALDFRQVKTIILSDELTKDERMLKEVFDLLSRNNQVGNNTIIASYSGEEKNLIQDGMTIESSLSFFLENFLKNNKNNYITSTNFDIDSVLLKLRNGETIMLPVITKQTQFEVTGSNVITDFIHQGDINIDLIKGYAFLKSNANETPIVFNYNNKDIFVKVMKSKSKINFYENNDKLYVTFDIKVDINYMNSDFSDEQNRNTSPLTHIINDKVENLCISTFNYFKGKNIDGLYLKNKLEQQNPKLYKKYYSNNEAFLNDLNIILKIDSQIESNY